MTGGYRNLLNCLPSNVIEIRVNVYGSNKHPSDVETSKHSMGHSAFSQCDNSNRDEQSVCVVSVMGYLHFPRCSRRVSVRTV